MQFVSQRFVSNIDPTIEVGSGAPSGVPSALPAFPDGFRGPRIRSPLPTPPRQDAYAKQFQVEGQAVLLDILDTAGQEELRAMREQYMRAGQGFLLVYSLADRQSFLALADTYRQLSRVKDLAGGSMPVVVVASKCDIDPDERQVSEAEGRTFARSIGCPFIETSAKLRLNVDSAFELLLKR